jgi:hypothetical protein
MIRPQNKGKINDLGRKLEYDNGECVINHHERQIKHHEGQIASIRRVINNFHRFVWDSDELNRTICNNSSNPEVVGKHGYFMWQDINLAEYSHSIQRLRMIESFAERADPLCNAVYAYYHESPTFRSDFEVFFDKLPNKYGYYDDESYKDTFIEKIIKRQMSEPEYLGILRGEIPLARDREGRTLSLPKGFGYKFLTFTEKYCNN